MPDLGLNRAVVVNWGWKSVIENSIYGAERLFLLGKHQQIN
jgi:hypothetical protein